MAIAITQDWLNQVKKVQLYPIEENLIMTDDQIKEFCVFPAMMEYFTKFPMKSTYETTLDGEMSISFPDEYTIGLLDARLTDIGAIGGTGTGFWDLVMFQAQNIGTAIFKTGIGVYGAKGYNPSNLIQQREMSRQAIKSQQNLYSTIKYRVDIDNRKLIVYTSIQGHLNIIWAKYSNDFDNVRFTRKLDVIKIAQAYLLEHFADTVGVTQDSGLEVSINVEAIKDRAKELRESIKESWDAIPAIIYQHFV